MASDAVNILLHIKLFFYIELVPAPIQDSLFNLRPTRRRAGFINIEKPVGDLGRNVPVQWIVKSVVGYWLCSVGRCMNIISGVSLACLICTKPQQHLYWSFVYTSACKFTKQLTWHLSALHILPSFAEEPYLPWYDFESLVACLGVSNKLNFLLDAMFTSGATYHEAQAACCLTFQAQELLITRSQQSRWSAQARLKARARVGHGTYIFAEGPVWSLSPGPGWTKVCTWMWELARSLDISRFSSLGDVKLGNEFLH